MKEERYDDLLAELQPDRLPKHIAIIMDGNGRWASKRFLPRSAGHKAGAEAMRRTAEICREIGIPIMTVYAFSTENWKRPAEEVGFLMELLIQYLKSEVELMNEQQIRLGFLGDMNGLPQPVQTAFREAMAATAKNDKMILNLAVNYGGRDELVRGFRKLGEQIASGALKPEDISEAMISDVLDTAGEADPDLLIRPSGEYRTSNFLVYQSAYSELWFCDKNWPDFGKRDLLQAVLDYQKRDRRFGKVSV